MDFFVLSMLLVLLGLVLFVALFLNRARKQIQQMFSLSEKAIDKEPAKHDLVSLEYHVHRLEKKGYSKQAILKKLTAVGWEEHLVDLVLYEVHKPHNRLRALEHYVQQQLLKAKPKEIIKENLLNAGWEEEIIDLALGLEPIHHEGEKEHSAEV